MGLIGVFVGFIVYFASEYPIGYLLKLIPSLVTTNLAGMPGLTAFGTTISIILQVASAVFAGIWVASHLK